MFPGEVSACESPFGFGPQARPEITLSLYASREGAAIHG